MAFTDTTLTQAAFKKLFGLAHTEVKTFPLGNEANPSQITIVASDVYTEAIPATAQAVANRIIACTNSTNGQTDSYLTVAQNLTIAPDGAGEGHPYLVTIPAGHGLIGETNPLTGLAYVEGDIVMSIIPKKFGITWRPVLYDSTKTEIPPLSSLDWIIDERGFIVIRDNSTAPAYLKCWVYIGKTLSLAGIDWDTAYTHSQETTGTPHGNAYLAIDGSNANTDIDIGANGFAADGYKFGFAAKTGAYTLTSADDVVTASGTFTLALPTAVGITGKVFYIVNVGTGVITIDGNGGETIAGLATYIIRNTHEAVTIASDGSNWVVL